MYGEIKENNQGDTRLCHADWKVIRKEPTRSRTMEMNSFSVFSDEVE